MGDEGAARRLATARDDRAAMHRRHHRQGYEQTMSPMGKEICSKPDIQKTATGMVIEARPATSAA